MSTEAVETITNWRTMDKLLLDYIVEGTGLQALATLCVVGWVVKWVGDPQVAVGMRRLAEFLELSPARMFPGPDWFSQPLAAASMTVYSFAAGYLALCALLAVSVALAAEPLRAMVAFGVFLFGMGLCLRMARISRGGWRSCRVTGGADERRVVVVDDRAAFAARIGG